MKVEFPKGSEMFFFFRDYWNFVQKFWGLEETDEYWDELILAAEKLYHKYPNDFAKFLIWALIDEQERKWKEKGNGGAKRGFDRDKALVSGP